MPNTGWAKLIMRGKITAGRRWLLPKPVLAGMLEHGWIEAELETGHPENRQIMETYAIEGWPFFVLIGPDGTILARNYTNAFYRAKKILDKELGGTAAE